jgi:uncharacterized protein YdbL (DUF1318 family)
MSLFRIILASLAAAVMAGALALAHAQGDPALEQAKAQGVIGEMFDGYLGIADPTRASADLLRRVEEVNGRRLGLYTETSRSTGEPVATIAALTALKQIDRAAPGEMVKAGPDQPWRAK